MPYGRGESIGTCDLTMKAMLPAAGYGNRLRPLLTIHPSHWFPLAEKP